MPSLDDQSYTALRQDLASLLENERSAKRQGLEQEKAQTYWGEGGALLRGLNAVVRERVISVKEEVKKGHF